MLAGIQEVLTIVLIVVCIIFVPRLFRGGEPSVKRVAFKLKTKFSWQKRLGIVFSVMWPVGAGLFLKPWDNRLLLFLIVGILPVSLGWAVLWIAGGFKKNGLT